MVNNLKVAIRADASLQIGTGHVMRCATLGKQLRQHGAEVHFISRLMPGDYCDWLENQGFKVYRLPAAQVIVTTIGESASAHVDWLGVTVEQEIADSRALLAAHAPFDWLVVDHYGLDAFWESEMSPYAAKRLVIDDLADRMHDCDVLLDQNFYTDKDVRYIGKVPERCQLLLGPRYALLRDEFRQLREQVKPRSGPVKRVLIFFGGIDAANYTARAIEALSSIGRQDLHVDVVIGTQHPHREQIESVCSKHAFVCHVQTNRMAELMAAADLAIGAGGSAIWERCCLGLPTLTICAADNQSKQIADAAFEGLLYTPELKDELISVIKRHMSALMENGYLRHSISCNGMQVVDDRGVLRVIRSMDCSSIEIRPAIDDDSQNLFEWRNHPTIRGVSHSADIINWESHQQWFASVLSNPDRLLLIGQCEDLPIGVVRFDIEGDEAEVSIYLVPDIHGLGRGRELLQSAERWFITNRPEVCKIRAHVLGGNERSQRLFLGAGYQVESTCYSKRFY